ncbi:carboxylesterase family protein [Streptomyces scabiei]|uniref:carboxylesterase/lipase family protein n=1 Tax=Streptomyces scabiei TaxID=1930 RepID=UPI00298F9E6E|nr:carboxylesterase family protein [Streptomyces scabiei]MDW8809853.1 carboxylesterase family protein [Streptomyces scabiei]
MSYATAQVAVTEQGHVRGAVRAETVAFLGIPYAAPPVGPLRFAPPRPHPGWTEVREAAGPGPDAPQGTSRLEALMGPGTTDWDEDGCLTLNVWTPRRAFEGVGPRPVLLWFHGGGFANGSSGWGGYDGARLAELGDMVVVTANYRLGPLGFLYLPEIGSENLGLQDQAVVLRWVRNNIAAFGGDPGAVTVGGQSAGAFCALLLAIAPETGRMVRRVLLQSCPLTMSVQDPGAAAETAEAYLRLLGIRAGTDPGEALRSLPVERLLSAYGTLAADHARVARPGDVTPVLSPVRGAGTPRAREKAVTDGGLRGKDLLIGTTRDEMMAFYAFNPRIRSLAEAGALDMLKARFGEQAQATYERYATPHATPAQVLGSVHTDALFRDRALRVADRHASEGGVTYVYEFGYRRPDDVIGLGACHCSELPFLFGTFDSYRDSPMLGRPGEREHALARGFAGAVAEFVTTGSPNDWPPYVPSDTTSIRHFG